MPAYEILTRCIGLISKFELCRVQQVEKANRVRFTRERGVVRNNCMDNAKKNGKRKKKREGREEREWKWMRR